MQGRYVRGLPGVLCADLLCLGGRGPCRVALPALTSLCTPDGQPSYSGVLRRHRTLLGDVGLYSELAGSRPQTFRLRFDAQPRNARVAFPCPDVVPLRRFPGNAAGRRGAAPELSTAARG